MVRADDQATFEARAIEIGLLSYTTPAQNGQPAEGPLVPLRGVTISRIGSIIKVPGVYDDSGALVRVLVHSQDPAQAEKP